MGANGSKLWMIGIQWRIEYVKAWYLIIALLPFIASCGNMGNVIPGNEEELIEKFEEPVHKHIQWKDGNTYPYDYIDEYIEKDSIGRNYTWTVYRSYPSSASDVECHSYKCHWCGKEVNSTGYSFKEYPTALLYRIEGKQFDLFNLGDVVDDEEVEDEPRNMAEQMMASMAGRWVLAVKKFTDYDNHKILLLMKKKCKYDAPEGFCSLKCQYEYKDNN